MSHEPPPSFNITLREVWDVLTKLRDDVGAMTPQARRIDAHSQRIRRLERWMWLMTGALIATGGASITALFQAKP